MKRSIRLNFNNGSEPIDLELVKATALSGDVKGNMIHIDEMKDGKYRLIYTEDLIPDFSKIKNIEVVRGEDTLEESDYPLGYTRCDAAPTDTWGAACAGYPNMCCKCVSKHLYKPNGNQ